MRVLDIGAYDLGYDWLNAHSPMLYDHEAKSMQFFEKGVQVTLSRVTQPEPTIIELSAKQLVIQLLRLTMQLFHQN